MASSLKDISHTMASRFWSKVKKLKPTQCWPWNGSLNNKGYGMLSNSPNSPMLAHRVSYLLHSNCDLKAGQCVCHTCDNPACVNPSHLWVGSHADNLHDMAIKGRWTPRNIMRGELHPLHKLTILDVAAIRDSILPQRKLAKIHGVSQTTVWRIRNNLAWPE